MMSCTAKARSDLPAIYIQRSSPMIFPVLARRADCVYACCGTADDMAPIVSAVSTANLSTWVTIQSSKPRKRCFVHVDQQTGQVLSSISYSQLKASVAACWRKISIKIFSSRCALALLVAAWWGTLKLRMDLPKNCLSRSRRRSSSLGVHIVRVDYQ